MEKYYRVVYKHENGTLEWWCAYCHILAESEKEALEKYNTFWPRSWVEVDTPKCEIVRIEPTPTDELEEYLKNQYFISNFVIK